MLKSPIAILSTVSNMNNFGFSQMFELTNDYQNYENKHYYYSEPDHVRNLVWIPTTAISSPYKGE